MIRHLVAMLIAAVVVLAMAPAAGAQTDEELIRELQALREELRGQRFDQDACFVDGVVT